MTQFVPHKPEEIVVVKVTKREAVLLQKLRKSTFGVFTIHKMNGLIMRIEATSSEMIDETGIIDL